MSSEDESQVIGYADDRLELADQELSILESTAKAATPGDWIARGDRTVSAGGVPLLRFYVGRNKEANAAFIAAWNPTTALSILSRLQAAETEVERQRDIVTGAAMYAKTQAETIEAALRLNLATDGMWNDENRVSKSGFIRTRHAAAITEAQRDLKSALSKALPNTGEQSQ